MKKRLYMVFLCVLAIIITGTAFIPITKNYLEKENRNVDLAKIHPEAGYIEEIGN